MKLIERFKAPTPKFFRITRNIGAILAGIAGVIVASPVVLPSAVVTAAGYLTVSAGILGVFSQASVMVEPEAADHIVLSTESNLNIAVESEQLKKGFKPTGEVVKSAIKDVLNKKMKKKLF